MQIFGTNRARARVKTGTREQQTETFELQRQGNGWRISSFDAG